MQYRVGVVNFLNAFPLWAALEKKAEVQLFPDIPSRLAERLHRNELDAALISSVEFLRYPQGFSYHPRLCIAALTRSESIRLFVPQNHLPFREALHHTSTIYTDMASRSSVAQLRVILQNLHLTPQLKEVAIAGESILKLGRGEALLAIGDTALQYKDNPSYDLQTAYYEIFQRGFVYALWVGRSEKMHELEPLFDAAYQEWGMELEGLLAEATRRFGFTAEFTRAYLCSVIEHRLSTERKDDLEFFGALWRQISGE